ncbi:MAG TPA: HAMP domain-containing protein, partial [Sulfurovum sp.]|nr:HAMP domain-containing protein [Sulfurovum sp.]
MSIYNKIRIIFLVAVLFTTAFFGSFFYIQKSNHIQSIEKRYMQTSLYIHRYFRQNITKGKRAHLKDPNLKLFLTESDFSFVKNHKKIKNIIENSHLVHQRKVQNSRLEVRGIKGQFYLYIKNPRFQVMLKDKQRAVFPWQILLWYSLALLFLTALYFWLTRSLKPLKTLQRQIQKVVDGDLSVSVKSNKNDEIAQVANAFDDALRKLESLINSRQLFLRSIMHELKTPIAKGKLLNEFLENSSSQKGGYEAVFERLELLIEEFSKIERMLSSSYKAKLAPYNAQDIIEQALELMIMDEDEIQKS